MPQYSYTNPLTKETIERSFSIGQQPGRVKRGGEVFWRNVVVDARTLGGMCHPGTWPMETTFVGCTPNSVAEQREFLKGKGVGGVRVHDDGHLTIDNQTAYKDYQRAKGFINYDGGYGDMNDTHASAKEDVRTGD